MKKNFVLLLMVLTLFLFLSSPGLANEKILKIGIAKEPAKLNPILIPGIYGESVAGSIFDTLVSFKENASIPAPALAEKWDISQDGKEYTFYLRKNVTFHNGQELTADDVKFTIESIMDPANASPGKEFFSPVEKVEIKGDYIVKLTLKEPYAPMMLALGNATSGIVPKSLIQKIGMDEFDSNPVGTGPFKFVEWLPDDKIVLVKNKNYFLGSPNIDKVIFRPIPKPEVMAAEIESGGIDIAHQLLPQDIKRLKKNDRLKVLTIPGLGNSYIGFSYKSLPFSDVRFRKAIYHAVPFDAAINGIWRGVGIRSYSWIPTGVFPDDTKYMKDHALTYDKDKAAKLFDALKKDGIIKDGFEFSIYTSQKPARVKIATAVATELRKFGIKAKVEALEWGSLFPILKKGTGMYIMGWGSVPDPDRWTYKIFHSGSTMNFSKYERPEIDFALEQGRILVGAEKRGAEYKKVMRQALTRDYIHIPLVFRSVTAVVNKKVKGFKPSSQDYFHLVTEKRNISID